jgi:hypothetical protein
MLETTDKRIKLAQQLFAVATILLLALCGAGFYFARRLARLENKLGVRLMKRNQPDEQAVEWQKGMPP